jgi:hypothetical protein
LRTAKHPDGRLVPDLSPTSASKYLLCPRKWGHHYLDGIRGPRSPSLRRGELVHDVCEARLEGRADPPRPVDVSADEWAHVLDLAGRILSLVPGRASGMLLLVESGLALFGEHARWEGRTDLVWREPCLVVVSDHKTTRSREHALSEDELPGDPQGALYGAWACVRWGLAEVGLQWTYATTHGRRDAWAVRARASRARAHDEFHALDERVGAAVAEVARSCARSVDLEQNWSSCDAYGGCEYRPICGERPAHVALEMILSQDTGFAGQVVQKSIFERLQESRAQQGPAGEVPPGPYAAVNRSAAPEHAQLYEAAQPPGQQPPHPALAQGAPAQGMVSAPQGAPAQDAPAPQVQHRPDPALAPVPDPSVSPAQHAPLAHPGAGPAQHAPVPPSAPAQHGPGSGFVLLVGCSFGGAGAPQGASVHRAEDLVAAAHDEVRRDCNVPDYRVVEYGHGRARLAWSVVAELQRRGVGPGHFVVAASTRTDEWSAVGQVLVQRALVVVMGGA